MVYLLYFVADLGFIAIPIATNLHFLTRFSFNCGVVLVSKKTFKQFDDVKLFSKQSCTDYGDQLKICLNSLSMSVWGWWAFDIFTLIASYLHAVVIAA